MESIYLAIITDDKEYGKALAMAMNSICGNFKVELSDCRKFLEERKIFYQEGVPGVFLSKFDLILWDGEEAESVYGEKIVMLSADPVKSVKDYRENRYCLYKYSSARTIVSSIFEIYSCLTGKRVVGIERGGVQMIAIASCAGGVGCTTIAMAVGQELCRFQGKRVMYVSLEEIESVGGFMDGTSGVKGVGVYLYHLFKTEKGYPFLEGYVICDDFGMESFAPTGGRNPLRNLDADEFNVFIGSLISCGRYDAIIMDIGSCLSSQGISCMELAGKICLLSLPHIGNIRESQYLQHLIYHCGEPIMNKMIKVENKVESMAVKEENTSYENNMLEVSMCVSRYRDFINSGETKKVILEGNFGEDIKRLTMKLTEPLHI